MANYVLRIFPGSLCGRLRSKWNRGAKRGQSAYLARYMCVSTRRNISIGPINIYLRISHERFVLTFVSSFAVSSTIVQFQFMSYVRSFLPTRHDATSSSIRLARQDSCLVSLDKLFALCLHWFHTVPHPQQIIDSHEMIYRPIRADIFLICMICMICMI